MLPAVSQKKLLSVEQAVKRDLLKNSYFDFFQWAFKIHKPYEKLEVGFHIWYLCQRLQKEQERIERGEEKSSEGIIINIPPRTSKSLICSVILNAWVWTRMPSATFICISYKDTLAENNARYCREIIFSPEYQELFGDIWQINKDSNSITFFRNNKSGHRISRTTGASITGESAIWTVVDDPADPETAESDAERIKVNNYWTQALFNRLTPIQLGCRLLVMQRLHELDLSGHLLKNFKGDYEHICLPIEWTPKAVILPEHLTEGYRDVEEVKIVNGVKQTVTRYLLDPVRLGIKEISSFLKTLAPRGFSGQYMQSPAPAEGLFLKEGWFRRMNWDEVKRKESESPMLFTIDTAYTEKKENDPSGILTGFLKYDEDGIMRGYIVNFIRHRLRSPELCQEIKSHTAIFQRSAESKIFIEPKANGISIVDEIRMSNPDIPVFNSEHPDRDRHVRVNGIAGHVFRGEIVLINGPWTDDFLKEVCGFPTSEHDEAVDCLVIFINECLKKSSRPLFL